MYLTNGRNWTGSGSFWQMVGVLLVLFTILQFLPEELASGSVFSKKALAFTLGMDAIYVYMFFVAPFVKPGTTLAMFVVTVLVGLAIMAYKKWH
jgi:hypothetical protein